MNEKLNLNDENIQVKLEKLQDIIKDIEDNGLEGDHMARQIVLSAISKSDNKELYKKIEDMLLDDASSEVAQTVAAGLIMSKANGEVFIKYVDKYINNELIIDKNLEDKEALLITVDGLIESIIKSENTLDKEDCFKALSKLYQASCTPKSTAYIADKLLQRFINLLPSKDKFIDTKLLEIIKNKDFELNARLVAIDVIGRSNPIEFFSEFEELIKNLEEFTNNAYEQVYFLDVLTKFINNVSVSSVAINYYNIFDIVNNIDYKTLLKEANKVYGEDVSNLIKRIKNRLQKMSLKSNN